MVHRTMQGKVVDMDKLMSQNELMPAVGNIRVNARGDELGTGGAIIRKREDVVGAYYEDNPNAAPRVVQKAAPMQQAVAPVEEAVKEITAPTKTKKTQEEE